jgi:hypothetical protein
VPYDAAKHLIAKVGSTESYRQILVTAGAGQAAAVMG